MSLGTLLMPKDVLQFHQRLEINVKALFLFARGFDGCLAFYTKEEWEPFCQKLLALPSNKKEVRKAIRFTISSASECEFDKLGRINIPTNLRTLAGLEKECVIIGAGNHGEIWSQEKWDQYYNDNQDGYDDILESLDDFSL